MLRLERDHLEKALMGANKRVQELATPEACQYRNLLEKFENLERRHEVREQKLQSIVKDLLANNNSEPVPCGTVCRSKHLTGLERKMSALIAENKTLREKRNESATKDSSGCGQSPSNSKKCSSSSSRCPPSSSNCNAAATAKEDAHLLATIRGMKLELSSKEKEMLKLSRELEDARMTNKRLQREREKQLKTASPLKPSSEMSMKSDKSTTANVELPDSNLGRDSSCTLYHGRVFSVI